MTGLHPSTARRISLRVVPALMLALAPTLAACGDSSASSERDVQVEDAWARTSPMDAANGAAYFTITSPVDDVLVGVTIDPAAAARAELHETVPVDVGMDGTTVMPTGGAPMGEMTMQPVDSIDLPAGTAVSLQPGGLHVMLLDLAVPLEVGDTITITLTLEKAGTIDVEVPVLDEAP